MTKYIIAKLSQTMIKKEKQEEIKNQIDIVDIIGSVVNLKKTGTAYKGLSPFTNEKTPSFFVYPKKGFFKCFSSDKGGDAITFLQEYHNLNFFDAMKWIASRYGIEIKKEKTPYKKKHNHINKKEEILKIAESKEDNVQNIKIANRFAMEFFRNNLLKSINPKKYLRHRMISDESMKNFYLGFAQNSWHSFENNKNSNIPYESLIPAGLLTKKENKYYDRFRNRIMLPIFCEDGRVLGFAGRRIENDYSAKYLNSPETELYKKNKILYGLFQSKTEIQRINYCIIVEGYFDVISLHQKGIKNVVSSCGTSLTTQQIKLIKKYTNNVILFFDGDNPGVSACLKSIDQLMENDIQVKIIKVSKGEDPDSLCQKSNVTELKNFIKNNKKNPVDYKKEILIEKQQSSLSVDEFIKKMTWEDRMWMRRKIR